MEIDGISVEEHTLSGLKINFMAFLLFIPIALINMGAFLLLWDYEHFIVGKRIFFDYILSIFIVGIVLHELLHGISWAYFAKNRFKSISFGINWKYLAPYCHCKEPLKVNHYRFGGALPLIVLGIIPSIIAIITGSGFLLTFGILFTAAAGGDIISLFMLRRFKKDTLVFDHPDKMGFYIEKKIETNQNPDTSHD